MKKKTKSTKKSTTKKIKKSKKVEITEFSSIESRFLLVRVGTKDDPAEPKQIKEIETQLVTLFEKNNVNCLALVTHHAVAIDMF